MTLDRSLTDYQEEVAAAKPSASSKKSATKTKKAKPHQLDMDIAATELNADGKKKSMIESGNAADEQAEDGMSVSDAAGTIRLLKAKLQVVTKQLEQVLVRAKTSVCPLISAV